MRNRVTQNQMFGNLESYQPKNEFHYFSSFWLFVRKKHECELCEKYFPHVSHLKSLHPVWIAIHIIFFTVRNAHPDFT